MVTTSLLVAWTTSVSYTVYIFIRFFGVPALLCFLLQSTSVDTVSEQLKSNPPWSATLLLLKLQLSENLTSQAICAFCMLKNGFEETPELITELKVAVRNDVGAFCAPDMIVISPSLPMTRSGKIMRRILRKIVSGETDSLGDTSTLADPSIVDTLIEKVTKPKELAGSK
jgi:acyl-CoA synthetase (AMP-forming)/AMP-acid ligase II